MDAPQKHLPLPLPKTYRPPMMWKIGMLLAYLVFLLLFLSFLAFFIIELNSPLNIGFTLLYIFLCITFLLIILGSSLYIINQFRLRLELHPQGVLYSALGQRLYAPWSDITSYDLQDDFKRIILREGVIRGSLADGFQCNIAVHEVASWASWWIGSGPRSSYFSITGTLGL